MMEVLNLADAWEDHVTRVLADRDDAAEIHGSDLHACAFALHQRVHGEAQMPFDQSSFANFERGHAYETRLHDAIVEYAKPRGFEVSHGRKVTYRGIVGNLDWTIERDGKVVATIDLSTTASKLPEVKYGHALKSAFYALAVGADQFCEWVFCIGFGGKIVAQQPHWFSLDEEAIDGVTWRDAVHAAIEDVQMLVARRDAPIPEPPTDPFDGRPETWRCGKRDKNGVGTSYCRAKCPKNAAYDDDRLPE